MSWWKREEEDRQAADPEKQNKKHITRVLRTCVERGDLERLKKLVPANYDWAQSYNPREPPLLHVATAAPFFRANPQGEIGTCEEHVKIIQWMLSCGADPQRPAPADCDGTIRVPPWTLFAGAKYGSHSAISLGVELLAQVEDALEQCDQWWPPEDLRQALDYLQRVVVQQRPASSAAHCCFGALL